MNCIAELFKGFFFFQLWRQEQKDSSVVMTKPKSIMSSISCLDVDGQEKTKSRRP